MYSLGNKIKKYKIYNPFRVIYTKIKTSYIKNH